MKESYYLAIGIATTLSLLGTAGGLLWAYQTDLETLPISAQVLKAECHFEGGIRKRAEVCYASLWLAFTYNNTYYYNVSMDTVGCDVHCYATNSTVYIALHNQNPYDIEVVDVSQNHHITWFLALGVIMLIPGVIFGILLIIYMVNRCRLNKPKQPDEVRLL